MSLVRLSLVSHTNVGKTTLARTLLGRDVGEVRDAPHVTEFAEMHVLLKSDAGDVLQLWDTPGFGDSVRLARRLEREGTPVGWVLTQVWDRWRDRGFWASQQALRHVRDDSDVVLYLVNASESPAAAAFVDAEMRILAWMDKPALVLLNQMGAPRPAAEEQAEVERWRRHLAPHAFVREVLPLDAFARCWVQEGALLRAVGRALDPAAPEGDERLARLHAAWAVQRLALFDSAVLELADSLMRIAGQRVPLPTGKDGRGWIAETLGFVRRGEADDAGAKLAAALDAEVRGSTERLLMLHGIEGQAAPAILERVASQIDVRQRMDEGRAALVGGVVSGAISGLAADLVAGGLTLGGGMLAGGLLGALGAAGLARGLNVVRGTDRSFATWSAAALPAFADAALLRYLAVAHFGRGRGQWSEGEAPAHWRERVAQALAPRREAIAALLAPQRAALLAPVRGAQADDAEAAAALAALLREALRAVLAGLYPGAWPEGEEVPAAIAGTA